MLYSCTRMTTVGVKGLSVKTGGRIMSCVCQCSSPDGRSSPDGAVKLAGKLLVWRQFHPSSLQLQRPSVGRRASSDRRRRLGRHDRAQLQPSPRPARSVSALTKRSQLPVQVLVVRIRSVRSRPVLDLVQRSASGLQQGPL